MLRQSIRRLFQWGIAGLMVASLALGSGPPSAAAAAAPFYAISVSGPIDVCARPEELYPVRVVVTASTGNRTRRLPGIGIVADVSSGGGIQPTAAVTGGPLSLAPFFFQPAGDVQGAVTVSFKAVGIDPVTHQVVQAQGSAPINVVTCSYKLTIHGHVDVFKNAMDEIAVGDATATINKDNTLTGSGSIWMEQSWGVGIPVLNCTNTTVSKTFPITITGNVSAGGNVHFELSFSGDPIPLLSTQAMCDTGNHGSVGQKIPFWPVTPQYLSIDTIDIDAQGGVLDGPYPMKGPTVDYTDLSVIVDLVNPSTSAP